jgi:hypothetical protein
VPLCPKSEKQGVKIKVTHVSEDRTEGEVTGSLPEPLNAGVL